MGALKKMQSNAVGNLNLGSKTCAIISECRDVSQGIAQGDFVNAGVNAGLLGLYATPAGSAGGKVVLNSASMGVKAAAVGAMSQTLKNTEGHSQGVQLGNSASANNSIDGGSSHGENKLQAGAGGKAGKGAAPKRKMIIGGNWKCNGSVASMKALVDGTMNNLKYNNSNVEVVLAPISIHIASAKAMLNDQINVACQNMSATGNGAYTGEVSAE